MTIVEKLRELSKKAKNDKVYLPDTPVAQWLDGTVANPEKYIEWKYINLSELLQYIADMAE